MPDPIPQRFAITREVPLLTAALATLLLIALFAPLAGAAKDETTLVSRQSAADGGAGANGDEGSFSPAISADGRFVAFDSDADNLSGEDDNGSFNVFVRDLETNTTTLVSRQSSTDGGAGGNGDSFTGSISADGRFVAFQSRAENLSADANAGLDVFVRDLETNTTTLVSRLSAADGGAGGDDASFIARISADGRFVAFASRADNLSGADNNAFENIFVRDLETETTTLVSRGAGASGGGGDDSSFRPAISPDGRFVGFDSDADNLSGADNNDFLNVFVRGLETNTTTLVSRQSAADGGAGGDDSSFGASISDDGGRVEFASRADNLSGDDNNEFESIFVRDPGADTTTLVSRRSAAHGGGAADDTSNRGAISADGRFVGFDSPADNLSAADNDVVSNAFVRDLETETTTLVSRQSAGEGGAGGDGDSFDVFPSADGRFVAFDSEANNLSALDSDPTSDVFVRDVLGDTAPDTTPPVLDLSARKRQKAGKPVKVRATCDEDCAAEARGKAKRKASKKLKLKRASAELIAGETQKLRLKPSKTVARKLRRAGKAQAKITATAVDAAGNEATESVKVKLRRGRS